MKNLSDITAAILAGGLGTRLRPVIGGWPKVLAEVNGRPFLSYLLDQLAGVGVRKVALCTGYLGQQVEEAFGNTYGGMSLCYSHELSPLGTAGALRFALPLFLSDPVLVMNGDSFCDTNLKAFWVVHRIRRAQASILLTQVHDTRRFGSVRVENDGRISGFQEKTALEGVGWINAGIYLLSRSMIEAIPPGQQLMLERDIFPAWIGRGLYGFQCEARFLDIGTPESFAVAGQFFTQEKP